MPFCLVFILSVHYKTMLILFIRSLVLYVLVFLVIRLTGKRQLSDLQPFDLLTTLLVADLASVPASDTGMPLSYGVVPILTLFAVQQGVAYLSMKWEGFRYIMCGRPLLMIAKGQVQEQALRDARYTLNDLMEQLRAAGTFHVSDVEYAILETNGDLSVLLKGSEQQITYGALGMEATKTMPPFMIVQDGKVHTNALRQAGYDEKWLSAKLSAAGVKEARQLLFAFIQRDELHMQTKSKWGGRVVLLNIGEKK